jgi:hypothetical protein
MNLVLNSTPSCVGFQKLKSRLKGCEVGYRFAEIIEVEISRIIWDFPEIFAQFWERFRGFE